MVAYRYVFADLITDRTIDELDVQDVSFDRRIIGPGSFRGHIPIPDASIGARARRIVEGRTVVHVYRNADVWGTYIIWVATPTADRGGVRLELTGASLESYAHRREIRQTLTYTQDDQLDIARALITAMQASGSGDIGLTLDTTTSGVLRDREYTRGEVATYGKRLDELADLIDGFEFTIQTFENPATGLRVRRFVTGYPQLGQQQVDHVFAKPGNIVRWAIPGDATRGATSFQTRGDIGTDFLPLMSAIFDADELLAGGWPRIDMTENRQSASDQVTLDGWAQQLRARLSGSVRIPQPVVRLDENSSWNPNRLGDPIRMVITDQWWPETIADGKATPGYSRTHRVAGCEVTPIDRDSGQETVTLILESPEAAS